MSASDGARLLRQRVELGGQDLFLEGLTREQALALARAARKLGTTAPAAAGPDQDRPAGPRLPAAPDHGAARGATTPARPRPATSATASDARRGLPVLPDSYEELREIALSCTRCGLAETRTQVVFSDGVVHARLVVVGEAPGANEDATGLPFVGAAGKYLDLLLRSVGLSREESVYICNVLKCRPPGNRNPLPDEIEACSPFLQKQLELIRPEALLAVGSFAAQSLTGREGVALGKLRGEVHSYGGVPLVCTYHPAALLRNPKWTRSFWDDLQLLRNVMDGA
ncbi:MAG TPA: uracil-DNA glycosylase [Longimicrobiales bacterium]|nr:uracil-DNA glycosylase [Longimicrobiales bacterium]